MSLDEGRRWFAGRAWRMACEELSAADRDQALAASDLEKLAVAAHLAGMDAVSDDAWTRAYRERLRNQDTSFAVRCAFWLAFRLFNSGDATRGSGWMVRTQRLVEALAPDALERGYLCYLTALPLIFGGDPGAAHASFHEAVRIAEVGADHDLLTLARLGEGRALIMLGRTADGVVLLDEAMVAIATEDISPIIVGDSYCSAIEACQQIFDIRRARAWTEALNQWCGPQPDLVPYRGQCLVHRAEILQMRGAWPDAVAEVERARERLSDPPGQAAIGAAHYQQGELCRLQGEVVNAELAYRRAIESGRDPQPGLALLRLAQGRTDSAVAAIRRALDEAPDRTARSRLLPAYVEIMLALPDRGAARSAAEELTEVASSLEVPLAHALAAQATGAVLLAEGEARAALTVLRKAIGCWRELDAPYEAAGVQVLIGLSCRRLGDEDTAHMEWEAARGVYTQLRADPDVVKLDRLIGQRDSSGDTCGLTAREREVLRLVCRGATNKAIAAQLGISERTVDRHVSNILVKLGVGSRAAATAFAYEHRLV